MKKFFIVLIIFILLIAVLGGIFFLIDKSEYYSKGKTVFTLKEDMGYGITRHIGLGYVMYTRNTGFPTNPNDNIISTWFNTMSRDKAIDDLLGDKKTTINLHYLNSEIVEYYTSLIMSDLNKNSSKFNLDEIKTIYININNFEDLKTGKKLESDTITAIISLLNSKLESNEIKVVNMSFTEIEKNNEIYSALLKNIKDGIYVGINRISNLNEIDIKIHKSNLNSVTTRYKYDLNKLAEDPVDFNIFTEVN